MKIKTPLLLLSIIILLIISINASADEPNFKCTPTGPDCSADACQLRISATWSGDKLYIKGAPNKGVQTGFSGTDITNQVKKVIINKKTESYWTGHTPKFDSCNNPCHACLDFTNTKATQDPAKLSNYPVCMGPPGGTGVKKGNKVIVGGKEYDYGGKASYYGGTLYESYLKTEYNTAGEYRNVCLEKLTNAETCTLSKISFDAHPEIMFMNKKVELLNKKSIRIHNPPVNRDYTLTSVSGNEYYFIDSWGILDPRKCKVPVKFAAIEDEEEEIDPNPSPKPPTPGPIPKPKPKPSKKKMCRLDLTYGANADAPGNKAELDKLITILKTSGISQVYAYVFTSSDGTITTNKGVAQRRINYLNTYLTSKSIGKSVQSGFAFSDPTGPETNWFGAKTNNRRVIITTQPLGRSDYINTPLVAGKIQNENLCKKQIPTPVCPKVPCKSGEKCVNGKCVPDPLCNKIKCPEGEECKAGKCVPIVPLCPKTPCKDTEYCDKGVCKPKKDDDSYAGFIYNWLTKWPNFLLLLFPLLAILYLMGRRRRTLRNHNNQNISAIENQISRDGHGLITLHRDKSRESQQNNTNASQLNPRSGTTTGPRSLNEVLNPHVRPRNPPPTDPDDVPGRI